MDLADNWRQYFLPKKEEVKYATLAQFDQWLREEMYGENGYRIVVVGYDHKHSGHTVLNIEYLGASPFIFPERFKNLIVSVQVRHNKTNNDYFHKMLDGSTVCQPGQVEIRTVLTVVLLDMWVAPNGFPPQYEAGGKPTSPISTTKDKRYRLLDLDGLV